MQIDQGVQVLTNIKPDHNLNIFLFHCKIEKDAATREVGVANQSDAIGKKIKEP